MESISLLPRRPPPPPLLFLDDGASSLGASPGGRNPNQRHETRSACPAVRDVTLTLPNDLVGLVGSVREYGVVLTDRHLCNLQSTGTVMRPLVGESRPCPTEPTSPCRYGPVSCGDRGAWAPVRTWTKKPDKDCPKGARLPSWEIRRNDLPARASVPDDKQPRRACGLSMRRSLRPHRRVWTEYTDYGVNLQSALPP